MLISSAWRIAAKRNGASPAMPSILAFIVEVCESQAMDTIWMRQALELAMRGIGTTHPNPRVGAVVVKHGQCIGQGWHVRPGEPHAEVCALREAADQAKDACMYVTLEPCAATGRTPPCTRAIVDAGLRKVVYASHDPNPKMQGGGAWLHQQGITVVSGVLEREADDLNASFFHFIRHGMPYAIAKAAISLDGKMATHQHHSQWISSKASRIHAHALRASVDAIVVGGETFRHDNPSLTVRHVVCPNHSPLRVVVMSQAPEFSARWNILADDVSQVIMYLARASSHDRAWDDAGVSVVHGKKLPDIFRDLAQRGALSLLIEGGGRLHAACLEQQLVQECVLYQAPILIGGTDAPGFWHGVGVTRIDQAIQVDVTERSVLEHDQMIRGKLRYPNRQAPGEVLIKAFP